MRSPDSERCPVCSLSSRSPRVCLLPESRAQSTCDTDRRLNRQSEYVWSQRGSRLNRHQPIHSLRPMHIEASYWVRGSLVVDVVAVDLRCGAQCVHVLRWILFTQPAISLCTRARDTEREYGMLVLSGLGRVWSGRCRKSQSDSRRRFCQLSLELPLGQERNKSPSY